MALVELPQQSLNSELPQELQYRALSSAAVASFVAGVLSVFSFLSSLFFIIPICGMLLAIVSLQRINQHCDELTGKKLAQAGFILSTFFWAAGAGWLTYVHVYEVPDGYERISYEELQPVSGAPANSVPSSAHLLDGKRVFIKGYMYPGSQQQEIKEFVLVRDQGSCCFGGPTPKLTDMIQVQLKEPLTVNYSPRLFSFGGTFRVEAGKAAGDLGGVLYQLEADYLK